MCHGKVSCMSASLSLTWHDLLRYLHVWIYFLKWPLAFVAGWAGIHIRRWRKSRDENAAQGWPSVEGCIQSGTVKPIPKTFSLPCDACVHLLRRGIPHRQIRARLQQRNGC